MPLPLILSLPGGKNYPLFTVIDQVTINIHILLRGVKV
jgi:hypothetical protein